MFIINNLRMFDTKLALSLVGLLSIAVTPAQARFLGGIEISPLNYTFDYNSTLQCGECILGGYIFCVNGPEQYAGSKTIRTSCCRDKNSCPITQDKAWVCSSKYENDTLTEKFKVCPFDPKQCGAQNISFSSVGDSQCLRNNIKKGNVCLYKVKSQCGVPKF